MSVLTALATHLRGCPADCAFWAGDQVEYRKEHRGNRGRYWDPAGVVVGPSALGRPDPDETSGERVVREALAAALDAAGRVRVDWRGDLLDGISDMPAAWLRHRGPCPPAFAPGDAALTTWALIGGPRGIIDAGELVRVTGVAPSGIITVQAPDGRAGETWRSRLRRPPSASHAP